MGVESKKRRKARRAGLVRSGQEPSAVSRLSVSDIKARQLGRPMTNEARLTEALAAIWAPYIVKRVNWRSALLDAIDDGRIKLG